MANNTNQEFERVLAVCRELFSKKLYDYGASWRIMRPESLTDQIYIKAKRIRNLETGAENMVGEGIVPEFIGIVNYGLISLVQLEKGFADNCDITPDEAMALYDIKAKETLELMKKKNLVQNVLIEINVGGELSKSGFSLEQAFDNVVEVDNKYSNICIKGLMAMLPHSDDEKMLKGLCLKMRELYDKLKSYGLPFEYLSMGMSNDYLVAINNGSNMIRLGSIIFGKRNYLDKKEE